MLCNNLLTLPQPNPRGPHPRGNSARNPDMDTNIRRAPVALVSSRENRTAYHSRPNE
jgi:hypothetical protein